MSLAGISISVGILIDQAVVMAENAAHHLSRQFGRERVTGDTTEIVIAACRTVGRPIFFSVLDHHPLVPAGLRPLGPRREAVPPAGLHQDVRPDRRGAALDHARAGADPDLPQGANPVGGRELAGADDDRDLQADALVADGPADARVLAVRRDPRPGLRRLDPPGPRVHARPRRGIDPRHADDRAPRLDHPGEPTT